MNEDKIVLNKKELRTLSLLGNLLVLVFVYSPYVIGRIYFEFKIPSFYQFGYLMFYLILMIPAHELFHILPGNLLGIKLKKLGFKFEKKIMPVVYVHLVGIIPLKRKRLVDLAPTFILMVVPMFFIVADPRLMLFSITAILLNICGGIGDIFIFFKSLRYPANTLVEDLPDEIGMRIVRSNLDN